MKTETVVLDPANVRKLFPNALLAIPNLRTVEVAENNRSRVEVTYYDAVWGRTVVAVRIHCTHTTTNTLTCAACGKPMCLNCGKNWGEEVWMHELCKKYRRLSR